LIENQSDVASAVDLQPEFDPPPIIDPGAKLVMQGRYPTRPAPMEFIYKFVRENDQWRLIGLYVKPIPPAGEGKAAGD
jgi:hypothetical protein